MAKSCVLCKSRIEEWNEQCGGCGFTLVLEPDELVRAKYLRGPSLGALLWTQGWAFGARLYVLFGLSFVPIVGFVVLAIGLVFGRRLSWKYGGWGDWEEFKKRMRLLDILAAGWALVLLGSYFYFKK